MSPGLKSLQCNVHMVRILLKLTVGCTACCVFHQTHFSCSIHLSITPIFKEQLASNIYYQRRAPPLFHSLCWVYSRYSSLHHCLRNRGCEESVAKWLLLVQTFSPEIKMYVEYLYGELLVLFTCNIAGFLSIQLTPVVLGSLWLETVIKHLNSAGVGENKCTL